MVDGKEGQKLKLGKRSCLRFVAFWRENDVKYMCLDNVSITIHTVQHMKRVIRFML